MIQGGYCSHIHTQIQLLIYGKSYSCSSSRGYGATAVCLTPDQKVGSSNLSALIFRKAWDSFANQPSLLSLHIGI